MIGRISMISGQKIMKKRLDKFFEWLDFPDPVQLIELALYFYLALLLFGLPIVIIVNLIVEQV